MENSIASDEPQTLADVKNNAGATARWYQVLIGENLGRDTLKLNLSLKDFIQTSAVGSRINVENIEMHSGQFHAQRDLNKAHARGLGRYTLMGLVRVVINDYGSNVSEEMLKIRSELGDPAYVSLQPVVCNIRSCAPDGSDLQFEDLGKSQHIQTGAYKVALGQKQLMWVVDGQHRREGFDMVLEFLKTVTQTYRYPKTSTSLFKPSGYANGLIDTRTHEFWTKVYEVALTQATLSIECHLGLKEKEEQQLFYDLNSKVRPVQQSLAFQYDHTDPINKFVREELFEGKVFKFKPSERDSSDWQSDDGSMSRKDIQTVTCLLGLGKNNSKTATPAKVEERSEVLIKFWEIINEAEYFGSKMAKSKTLLAQPVMLKAIAKLGFDLAFGHQNIRDVEGYKTLCTSIISKKIDFSHSNKLWQSLFMEQAAREAEFPGISNYVHVPQDTNLDAGTYDSENGWVRFGSRHNDIFPRLGDIIRFKLNFKPRPSVEKLILNA